MMNPLRFDFDCLAIERVSTKVSRTSTNGKNTEVAQLDPSALGEAIDHFSEKMMYDLDRICPSQIGVIHQNAID